MMYTKDHNRFAETSRFALIIPLKAEKSPQHYIPKDSPSLHPGRKNDDENNPPRIPTGDGQIIPFSPEVDASNLKANPRREDVKKEPSLINEIRTIIQNNLDDENFCVQKLCREVGMSRSSLHRTLKNHTKKSTAQFICLIRLQKARELLIDSDLNITQIAFEVGFNDPKYFSRVFSSTFKQSPRSFRKSNTL